MNLLQKQNNNWLLLILVVNSAGRQLFLQAEDENDMRKWIDILNNASKITVSTVPKYTEYKATRN